MPEFFPGFLRCQRVWCIGIAALTSAVVALPASAQSAGSDASAWTVGGGVAVVKKGYRAMDRDVLPLPLLSYENKWISASVPTLDVKLYANDQLSLRVRTRYAGDGYDADDSPFLAGMADRKGGVWVGGAMVWRPAFANLTAEVLRDASGHSKGTRAKVQANRRFGFGALGVTPRLGVEWVDSKYVDYYYGVKAAEVRAERRLYQGDATANIEAGVRLDYTVERRHTVFLDLRASRFGTAINDSPLLERSGQAGVGLGYIYRF